MPQLVHIKMKLSHLLATALITFISTATTYAGVVIGPGGSYGINGIGKPQVAAVSPPAPPQYSIPLDLKITSSSSSIAAGLSLTGTLGLIDQLSTVTLSAGAFNVYKFTVNSCIEGFVSSVLFDEEIVGLKFLDASNAGLGLFVLGIEGKRLTFAGYSPFNSGFELEIYTAELPGSSTSATPEPSTLLLWGG